MQNELVPTCRRGTFQQRNGPLNIMTLSYFDDACYYFVLTGCRAMPSLQLETEAIKKQPSVRNDLFLKFNFPQVNLYSIRTQSRSRWRKETIYPSRCWWKVGQNTWLTSGRKTMNRCAFCPGSYDSPFIIAAWTSRIWFEAMLGNTHAKRSTPKGLLPCRSWYRLNVS